MIIQHHDKSRKRKKKKLTKKLSILNAYINFIFSKVSNSRAKEKSGTLITVDFALEQGKDIFALPGNITSRNSVGTNQLIGDGAKCVIQVKDILEEYGNFFSKN